MTYQGIDTAARISAAQAKILRDNGVSFVGRYLVPEAYSKALTANEAQSLRSAGLAILLCWEISAAAVKGGAARGAQDGAKAREIAEAMGIPEKACIYFACDYNIPNGELPFAEQYVKAAQAALGSKYEAGMYGPFALVDYLSVRGCCKKFWQCVAWSPRFLTEALTWQYQWQGSAEAKEMAAKVGFAVDMNVCNDEMTKAGFWMPYDTYDDGDGTVVEPQPWYAGAMAWAEEQGLMMDGRPNDPVTRAELATVLQRYDDSKRFSGLLTDD